jgi:eukaryotic-like serine/threonine-protein kinase
MSQADTDRNLLFGILALQMDFISRDALIAAMNAWVIQKHGPWARSSWARARWTPTP